MSIESPSPVDNGDTTQKRIAPTNNGSQEFIALRAPAPITEEKFPQLRDPEDDLTENQDGGRPVVAIAHQHGLVQDHSDLREFEAHSVLYATFDGEFVCERWISGVAEDLSDVPRGFIAPVDGLDAIGKNAKRFAPIVSKHPEF